MRPVCVDTRAVATTPAALTRYFAAHPTARVVCEVGTHSPWVARLLTPLVQEVIVAIPSAMYGRRAAAQADLALLRGRDTVVRARMALINHVRGAVKSTGARLPADPRGRDGDGARVRAARRRPGPLPGQPGGRRVLRARPAAG
jgi:hypothetical protein